MKLSVFTLVGPNAGKTMVIGGQYPFVDGVMKTNPRDGELMARILVPYYSCEHTHEGSDEAVSDEAPASGSLAKSVTQAAAVTEVPAPAPAPAAPEAPAAKVEAKK